MATSILPHEVSFWIQRMAALLHGRIAARLAPLLVGMVFARGRQTVACWLRAGGLGRDFRTYYYFLGSLGRKVKPLAHILLREAIRVIEPGERLLFALDDTPNKRYGPHVEGAGIHHNPTPGPAGQKYLYGHVWVTLSWVVRHPCWGTIGLPLLALLYVRRCNLGGIPPWYKVKFQTKIEQAAEMIDWLADTLKSLGKTIWLVADGAYAKTQWLRRACAAGMTVVSRLRKDAALWSVPDAVPAGRRARGRPRKYGAQKISLAKRAGHLQGWQRDTFALYGKNVVTTYKTFLATYKPAGGLILVVLVRGEGREWRAYFCTDTKASVAQVLEAVADRAAIEQNFHDLKEVEGSGQQQLRNYWANIAAYHMTMWCHTLIEMWAWHKPHQEVCDRSASPWDDATRRPSHADRRKAMRRQCLKNEFSNEADGERPAPKIRRLWKLVLKLMG